MHVHVLTGICKSFYFIMFMENDTVNIVKVSQKKHYHNCSLKGNLDTGAQSLFTTNTCNSGVASCAQL